MPSTERIYREAYQEHDPDALAGHEVREREALGGGTVGGSGANGGVKAKKHGPC
jgi:hypothetical protein